MTPKTEKTIVYSAITVGAGVILWLYFKRKRPIVENNAQNGYPYSGGFPYSPYIQYGNNGIPIASPSAIANSLSINVSGNGFGALSNSYMPLFGFIGQAGLA